MQPYDEVSQLPITPPSPLVIGEVLEDKNHKLSVTKQSLQLNKAELRACDLTSREVTVYISVKIAGR